VVLGRFNALSGSEPSTPKRKKRAVPAKRRRKNESVETTFDLTNRVVHVNVAPRAFYLRFSPFSNSRCVVPTAGIAASASPSTFPKPHTALQLYTLFCNMLHNDHVELLSDLLRTYPDATVWFLTPALAVGLDIEEPVPDSVFTTQCVRQLLRNVNLGERQLGVLLRHAIDCERFELLRALYDAGLVHMHSLMFDRIMSELEFVSGREFPRRVYAVQQFMRSLVDVRDRSAARPPIPLPRSTSN